MEGHGPHLARRGYGLGIRVNGSFVFGIDGDGPDVFERTVEWAISRGIETANFHILTPYPGTPLYRRMREQGRPLHGNWDLYDTRHTVFRPARHFAYAAGWKKLEPLWDGACMRPVVERVLLGLERRPVTDPSASIDARSTTTAPCRGLESHSAR